MTRVFEAEPKKWGNSLGITIPAEIVRKHRLSGKRKIRVMILPEDNTLRAQFGSIPKELWGEKTTQEILDENDEGEFE